MMAILKLDKSNRIVLPREIRRAARVRAGQKLKVSAITGRIVLEVEPNPGKVIKRGKLKVWSGAVPAITLEEAIEQARHYR